MAPRLHHGGYFRDRRQAHHRGLRQRAASEGILFAAVVDGPGLSPLRTGLGQRRPDRGQLSQDRRQEEKDAAPCRSLTLRQELQIRRTTHVLPPSYRANMAVELYCAARIAVV